MSTPKDVPMFVTWKDGDHEGMVTAMQQASAVYVNSSKASVARTERAQASRNYRNVDGNTSVRDSFSQRDWDYFRPGEALPVRDEEIICACMQAYKCFAMVRSMVDLMADFSVKGIDIAHPNKSAEKFGKEWFRRVKGKDRSERIANMTIKSGIAVIKRLTAKLPSTVRELLLTAGADIKIKSPVKLPAGEIPMGYAIHDPRSLEVIGGELAPFAGQNAFRYAVRVPANLSAKLNNPSIDEAEVLRAVPMAVRKIGQKNTHLLPLDPNKVATVCYKRDDHQVWPTPLLYPLLTDLQCYAKMRLADQAALDGAISHIRVWQLGDLKERILPTPAAVQTLSDILANSVGGGTMDLVWGPDLKLTNTSTEVQKFLGMEKYVPVLGAIYQGLGVPPTLTGISSEGGFSNNYISLRVLLERLEYIRGIIQAFWETELEILRSEFRFRQPFQIVFDQPTLSDDAAEKKLLIELVDRNIISAEYVQEMFGAIPEVESMRMQREKKLRDKGKLPEKAGPFHEDSRQQALLQRVALQQGGVTPSEVGLELDEANPDQKPFVEHQAEIQSQYDTTTDTAPSGNVGGRPSGAKDVGKRKQKKVKPRTTGSVEDLEYKVQLYAIAEAQIWSQQAQKQIEELVRPAYLSACKKENLRSLSIAEAERYEDFKFRVFCQFRPGDKITQAAVREVMNKPLLIPSPVQELLRVTTAKYVAEAGGPLPVEKTRQIQASVYALYCADVSEEG